MARRPDTIEKWSTRNRRTGEWRYYMHRLHSNGKIGEDESWSSRSGRSRKIKKLLAREPELIVKFRDAK